MKILIISPGFHPVTGGHGGAVENLINIYLQENEKKYKNDIIVYSAKNGESFDKQIYNYTKFRVIDIRTKLYRLKHLIKNILRLLSGKNKQRYYIDVIINDLKKRKEENYYDRIIFENGDELISTFRKKIKTSSKLILHLHNDHINVNIKESKDIISNVDEIWAVSKFIKNQIENVIATDKVRVLYNTIDYSLFEKQISSDDYAKLRNNYKIDEKDFVFIYVGRVMEDKGTLELVEAFDNVNRVVPNIKLLIVGGSISLKDESKYIEEVKKIAFNSSNIIFTGQIKNYEIYKYYQIADCQIIPSKWEEPFGLIALEGIASNLRIISSYSGGLPEVLEDNCLYVDKNNLKDDLIYKMKYVLNNPKKIDSLKYKQIKEKFSKENYCDTFNNYLK